MLSVCSWTTTPTTTTTTTRGRRRRRRQMCCSWPVPVLAVDLPRCPARSRVLSRLSSPPAMVVSRECRRQTLLAGWDSQCGHGLGLVPYSSISVTYGWGARHASLCRFSLSWLTLSISGARARHRCRWLPRCNVDRDNQCSANPNRAIGAAGVPSNETGRDRPRIIPGHGAVVQTTPHADTRVSKTHALLSCPLLCKAGLQWAG